MDLPTLVDITFVNSYNAVWQQARTTDGDKVQRESENSRSETLYTLHLGSANADEPIDRGPQIDGTFKGLRVFNSQKGVHWGATIRVSTFTVVRCPIPSGKTS